MTTQRPAPALIGRPQVVLCDLDGVVWLAHQAIPGSVASIAELRAAGTRVLFVTNNSASRIEEQEAALAAIGIPAAGDVLSSAQAAAALLQPGERVLVCGGEGILQALAGRGVEAIDVASVLAGELPSVAAVVVGFHRTFDYARLTAATRALLAGARLIGTNDDATYPTPSGPIPGGGSILAAIATASGQVPQVAGKPYEPMAALVRATVGDEAAKAAVMVGDRPETDGLFARTLGCRYAQVWSGVTAKGAVVQPTPDVTGDDLAAIVSGMLAG